MSDYRTPPGVDERRIPYPSTFSKPQVNELKRRGIYFINWNCVAMAKGPGMSTSFYDQIAANKRERKSTIIAILGAPGKGKTWFGLRLSEICDKKFDVEKQVVFEREHLLRIISGEIKINPGQCVLLDEAHMATGARHWFEAIQRDLIDQIATIRSMGIIMIFVVLHRSMLDKIIRQFVISYELHMEKRGLASVYEISMPRFKNEVYKYGMGKIQVSVPGIGSCPSPDCLWCEHLEKGCMNMRAVYERRKKFFLSTQSENTLIKVEKQRLKDNPPPTSDVLDLLYENKDFLLYTRLGTIQPSSVQDFLEKKGQRIGLTTATNLRNKLQRKYPDLKPPSKDTTSL